MDTFALILFVFAAYIECRNITCYPYPDVCMSASELAVSKGYPFETHEVVTSDGYILGLHRIPHGRYGNASGKPRPAVFLQHGLLCSSTNWLTNLVNQSFDNKKTKSARVVSRTLTPAMEYHEFQRDFANFSAYILADAGFDVFLGNNRGNTYSRRHLTLNDTDAAFWDFSWDQMALYDLPAMVDTSLKLSNQKSLHYIGHSQGTTTMFAGASENQTFASQIKEVYALAPIHTLSGLVGPLKYLSYFTWEIQDLLKIFGIHEFLPDLEIIKFLGRTVCDSETRIFCEDILFILCGFDRAQLNATRLPVYFNHVPAGTSTKNIVHFAQMVRSGKFQKYDYGNSHQNYKHYSQATPPLYNMSHMNISTTLFYGDNDWMADPSDVKKLTKVLTNLKTIYEIKQWDHLDFIWGIDAAQLIYHPIIDTIRKSLNSIT